MRGLVFQPLAEGCHPWIIISEERDGKVLAVNITDVSGFNNPTCVLGIGDHPIVTKPSAVYYKIAQEFIVTKLEKNLKKYCTVHKDLCSNEVLARIIEGALIDEDFTPRLREYLE
jgi:hypothetical protein